MKLVLQHNVQSKHKIQNVKRLDSQSTAVVVDDLKKWYGNFNAVKGVNFHVNIGDCFGLLGVNGAGKTSTFQVFSCLEKFRTCEFLSFVEIGTILWLIQMLTGENEISGGDASIMGHSVRNDWRGVTLQLKTLLLL